MNLLGVLKQEIINYNIKDKLKIAQYIYIRIGELFEYDPIWLFAINEEKEVIRNKNIDIENVTDFKIVCFSWARLYTRLLHEFGIVSRAIIIPKTDKNEEHAKVEVLIDGKIYIADLTASNKDIKNIKFGMETYYNCQIYKKPTEVNYHFNKVDEDIYIRPIKTEEIWSQIKKELEIIKSKLKLNNEEYIYLVFNTIKTIMNFPRKNVGFVCGVQCIRDLLRFFIDDGYIPYNKHFFNKDENIFIKLYSIIENRNVHYFAYKKMESGFYELHEVTLENIKEFLSACSSKESDSYLKLRA